MPPYQVDVFKFILYVSVLHHEPTANGMYHDIIHTTYIYKVYVRL